VGSRGFEPALGIRDATQACGAHRGAGAAKIEAFVLEPPNSCTFSKHQPKTVKEMKTWRLSRAKCFFSVRPPYFGKCYDGPIPQDGRP